MNPIRLLIICDDPFARAGLTALLMELPACQIIGQLNSADVLSSNQELELESYAPDVLLWDFGWGAAPYTVPEFQDILVPVVALLPDESRTAELWAAGVRVLLRRDMDAQKLETAVSAAAKQLILIDPALIGASLPFILTPHESPTEELTPREQEVLHLLAEGLTNKAIARQLSISDHTVKFHVNALMSKLGAQSRTEAVVRATRQGLLSL